MYFAVEPTFWMKPVHIQPASEEHYKLPKSKKIGICVKTLFNLKEEQIPSIAVFIEMQKILEADQVRIPFLKVCYKIAFQIIDILQTMHPCNKFFQWLNALIDLDHMKMHNCENKTSR